MENLHWYIDLEKWNECSKCAELISFVVKGTTQENTNGKKRSRIIEKMNVNERVVLKRESSNSSEQNTVGVYCASGMIGYVPKSIADIVMSALNKEVMIKSCVKTGQLSEKYVIIQILIPTKQRAIKKLTYSIDAKVVGISKDAKDNIVPYLDISEEVLVFFVFNQKDCRYSNDVYVTPKSYFCYNDETILGRLDKKSSLNLKKYIEYNIHNEISWFDLQKQGYNVVGSVKNVSSSGHLIVHIEILRVQQSR